MYKDIVYTTMRLSYVGRSLYSYKLSSGLRFAERETSWQQVQWLHCDLNLLHGDVSVTVFRRNKVFVEMHVQDLPLRFASSRAQKFGCHSLRSKCRSKLREIMRREITRFQHLCYEIASQFRFRFEQRCVWLAAFSFSHLTPRHLI